MNGFVLKLKILAVNLVEVHFFWLQVSNVCELNDKYGIC